MSGGLQVAKVPILEGARCSCVILVAFHLLILVETREQDGLPTKISKRTDCILEN